MKKFLSVLLSVISVICIACAFGACGDNVEAGDFYTLTEAYENGYLTREQVMSIAYYHNGGIGGNKEVMGEDYTPLPKNPEKLSAEKQAAIKQAHLDFYYSDKDLAYLEEIRGKKLDFNIDKYYGTYNGCIAVMTSDNFFIYDFLIWTETVADVNIGYGDSNRVMVWVKR